MTESILSAVHSPRSSLAGCDPVSSVGRMDTVPYIAGRKSMTVDQAKSILSRNDIKLIPEWCVNEAKQVMETGVYWVACEKS